jgi:hypothetical protein
MTVAYCPSCGVELVLESVEYVSRNIIYRPCNSRGCKYKSLSIIADREGFVIEPQQIRGSYVKVMPR